MTEDRNVAREAERALDRLGDFEQTFYEGRWYRYAAQADRAARLGAALVELGAKPGDRVAVMLENSPDVSVVYTAILRAGAAIIPVIFLLTAEELRRVITSSEASAIITAPAFLDRVKVASEGVDSVRFIVCTGEPQEGTHSLDALADHPRGAIVDRGNDDLALLLYTGGTTGRSKGVALSHSSVWRAGWAAHELRQPDIVRGIACLPLSHSYGVLGLASGLHATTPFKSVLMKWFEPRPWLQLAQDHQVQAGAVVPSMIYMLLQQPLEDYDLSNLRLIGSGAAPLTAEAREELKRRLPQIRVGEGYGLTETCGSATSMRYDSIKPGTVGQPVPGCEIKICSDSGAELPVGETGEICIRSGSVMLGYWNDPEQTKLALRDGWLLTGDIGRMDAEGFVTIVDRKKDIIIRGGFNVYPRDVEEALVKHPDVASAGVIGRPDPIHGEEVVAFIALQPGASATGEEIVAWARERLGGYKYPREVHVLPALPLTAVGKLDRKQLRAHLVAVEGAAVKPK